MKFVKKGVIMIDNPEDLKEKALANKPGLRRQYVNIPVGDEEYGFRISGIGAKAIKLEKYVKYDEIFEADPEILDLYMKYLEKTGRISFLEKVKKYV